LPLGASVVEVVEDVVVLVDVLLDGGVVVVVVVDVIVVVVVVDVIVVVVVDEVIVVVVAGVPASADEAAVSTAEAMRARIATNRGQTAMVRIASLRSRPSADTIYNRRVTRRSRKILQVRLTRQRPGRG
jgi:hypothetical protein